MKPDEEQMSMLTFTDTYVPLVNEANRVLTSARSCIKHSARMFDHKVEEFLDRVRVFRNTPLNLNTNPYLPETRIQAIGYIVEETGELVQAVGKTLRWGLDSYDPTVPENDRVANLQWVKDELAGLHRALHIYHYFYGNGS